MVDSKYATVHRVHFRGNRKTRKLLYYQQVSYKFPDALVGVYFVRYPKFVFRLYVKYCSNKSMKRNEKKKKKNYH